MSLCSEDMKALEPRGVQDNQRKARQDLLKALLLRDATRLTFGVGRIGVYSAALHCADIDICFQKQTMEN